MIEDALRDIPIEYRDRFRLLYDQPVEPTAALESEVRQYVATVKQVGQLVKMLDLSVAEKIGDTLIALLWAEGLADGAARLVNTATRYFVREEDDEEITGVLGFDDDIQVVNAICRLLDRPDLLVPFRPAEPDDG